MSNAALPGNLIVTADDFGAESSVNRAVIKAFNEGILRYASLMVNRPAAPEAVALAKENPKLGVGLHVELCSGNPGLWGLRYFFSPVQRKRIEPEIRSQIEKFLAFGLAPTHIDSHFHIHVHPVIFPIFAELAKEYKIPRLRLPRGEIGLSLKYERGRIASRLSAAGIFGLLGLALEPFAEGVFIPDYCYGLLRSGMMDADYVKWLIENLKPGTSEIYFHPCDDPGTRVARKPTQTHYTITELESLVSPTVKRAVKNSGACFYSR
ncbi:MAG: ChbG/HpnK family deacetylase [Elusimicrobiota bacterium]